MLGAHRIYASFKRAANGGANAIMREVQKMYFTDKKGKKIHPPIIPPILLGDQDEEARDFAADTVDYDREMDDAIKFYMQNERKGISATEIEDIQSDFLLYFISNSKKENDHTISMKVPNLYGYIQALLDTLDTKKPDELEEFQGKIKSIWGIAALNYVKNDRFYRSKEYITESGEATAENNYAGVLDLFLDDNPTPEAQSMSTSVEDSSFLEDLYTLAATQPNSASLTSILDKVFTEELSDVSPEFSSAQRKQLESFLAIAQHVGGAFSQRILQLRSYLAKGSLQDQIKALEMQIGKEHNRDKNSDKIPPMIEKLKMLTRTRDTNKARFLKKMDEIDKRKRRKCDIQYDKDAINTETLQAMLNVLERGGRVSGRDLSYLNPTKGPSNKTSSLPEKLKQIALSYRGDYALRVAEDAQGNGEVRFPIFRTAADMRNAMTKLFPTAASPAFLSVYYSLSKENPVKPKETSVAKPVELNSKTAKRIEAFLWSAGRNPKAAHIGSLQRILNEGGYRIVRANIYGDEDGFESFNDFDDDFEGFEETEPFADPGGRSSLRAGDRVHPCPTCGKENRLSAADVRRGYQCDQCADAEEGAF